MLTSEQLRAARALVRWEQSRLADTANVSVETVKRLERMDGSLNSTRVATLNALRGALEAAGVVFIPENGGGAGVRLKTRAEQIKGVDDQIEALEGHIAGMPGPAAPSPEAGMNKMRKALAEDDLKQLRNRRTRISDRSK